MMSDPNISYSALPGETTGGAGVGSHVEESPSYIPPTEPRVRPIAEKMDDGTPSYDAEAAVDKLELESAALLNTSPAVPEKDRFPLFGIIAWCVQVFLYFALEMKDRYSFGTYAACILSGHAVVGISGVLSLSGSEMANAQRRRLKWLFGVLYLLQTLSFVILIVDAKSSSEKVSGSPGSHSLLLLTYFVFHMTL